MVSANVQSVTVLNSIFVYILFIVPGIYVLHVYV